MKPKVELALRHIPHMLILVAIVAAAVIELVVIIAVVAAGDLFSLLFLGGMIGFTALSGRIMAGLELLDRRNRSRIAELEMEIELNSSDDGNELV